jgi:predicted transcriptional regulator of viral defense system
VGAKGASVLDEAARRRRRTIRWPEDAEWLGEITPAPQRLLHRLKDNGLLYAAGSNRFVIAPPGSRSIGQAASPELLADLALRAHGEYYIAFLSAFIAHHLTDLHSGRTYVAMARGARPRTVPEGLVVAELPRDSWPAGEGEVERIRVGDSKEFFFRSSPERTLVDGLLRPDLCGGMETVVVVWARARERSDVRWGLVAEIAARIGGATLRRVAFLLRELGLGRVVEQHLPPIEGRKTSPLFDRSREFDLPREKMIRDRATGVRLNVPPDYLHGWIAGASTG